MTESKFTVWFCKQLKNIGAITLTFVGGNVKQQSSLPDRYICHSKFRGWVEFKAEKGKLMMGQKLMLKALDDRGDTAVVCRWRKTKNDILIEDYNGNLLDSLSLNDVSMRNAGIKLLNLLISGTDFY